MDAFEADCSRSPLRLVLFPKGPSMNLSKSQYLRGIRCHKALWLYRHRREVMSEYSQQTLSRFATGHEVGKLAQSLFPGGVEIEYDEGDFAAMIENTRTAIERGEQVLYEATFAHEGVLIRADILVKDGDAWNLYEVKSSTRVKPENEHDVAIQWFVLSRHLPLGRAHLVHVDTSYALDGELDVHRLLHVVDLTDTVRDLQPAIGTNLAAMAETLAGDEPDIRIGLYCTSPYDCDFKAYCWRHVPRPSVFDLHNLRAERKFELFDQGRVRYEDLRGEELNATQSLQVASGISGELHIERDRLRDFLAQATYPINFLDFEALSGAVPKYQGQRPYGTAIPFQYSLHVLHADGHLEHREFLGDGSTDPRPELAARLVEDVTPTGSIVAYNQTYEKKVIGNLANEIETRRDALLAMHTRFIDLIEPFRQRMYYHPGFNGSFSIKSILPAMFPHDDSLSYGGLAIQEGEMASLIYQQIAEEPDESRRQVMREDLIAYCKLDTLAMVAIWRKLESLV